MAKRISLREFQENLTQRLASASRSGVGHALLGIASGGNHWLLDLSDSGEVVPFSELTPVPLTKPWFAGIVNIRGTLYSVVDFAAFCGREPTRRNANARLLLVGARYGSNSALLVDRTLGLRNMDVLEIVHTDEENKIPWVSNTYQDAQGRHWTRLDLQELLADPAFLDVGL
jgi:twitching motility protein PilI